MRAVILRTESSDKETIGHMSVFKDNDKVFECYTLELPWLNNQQRISCIPSGQYVARKRTSDRYGDHFHVLEESGEEVNGRSLILIHHGNYYKDTAGCILVGKTLSDINSDGYRDVTHSKDTMKRLNEIFEDEIELKVMDGAS